MSPKLSKVEIQVRSAMAGLDLPSLVGKLEQSGWDWRIRSFSGTEQRYYSVRIYPTVIPTPGKPHHPATGKAVSPDLHEALTVSLLRAIERNCNSRRGYRLTAPFLITPPSEQSEVL